MANYEINPHIGSIGYDFERAKAEIEERTNEYANIVFTEDTQKEAKKVLANLRKEKKGLETEVKAVKEVYMKPFVEFYDKAKEILDLYDKPIVAIDEQIKVFDEQRIVKKEKTITDFYDEIKRNYESIFPLSIIWNPKWLNVTFSENDIISAITTAFVDYNAGILAIKALSSDWEEKAISEFACTYHDGRFDLPRIIAKVALHEKEKADIIAQEAKKHQEELEQRIRADERKEVAHEQELKAAAQESIEAVIPDQEGETSLYLYRVNLTEKGKATFEMYMDSVGIEWECE